MYILLWQVKQGGKSGDVGGEEFVCFPTYPQYRLVLSTIAIGIFESHLRLANAPQTTDGLWLSQRGGLTCREKFVQLDENGFASGEERVTAIGNLPERCLA